MVEIAVEASMFLKSVQLAGREEAWIRKRTTWTWTLKEEKQSRSALTRQPGRYLVQSLALMERATPEVEGG